MDQIEFADGFDTPDTLAFGLGAGQLAVVMAGALAAYSLVRSTLPAVVVDPLAVLLAGSAAVLGWLKVSGRPALDWAIFAAQFWMRPRRGTALWDTAGALPTLANATQTDERSADPPERRRPAGSRSLSRGRPPRSPPRFRRSESYRPRAHTAPAASPSSRCEAAPDGAPSPPSSPA